MKQVADTLLLAAFDLVAGPALILDADLAVRQATPGAAELLGRVPTPGISAAAFLCGGRAKRPIADALAAGQPIQAIVPHPDAPGLLLRVRSLPLRRGRKKVGWVLLLARALEGGDEPELFHGLWSADPQMKRLFRTIEKVAQDDVPVLVRGETGAGKELVARALHAESPRRDGPFRAINCAALPSSLLESELFGHTRGAFTGAVKAMQGHVQLAQGGTLFLDEVAEVPLELQAKLLRVIETHEVIPVGAREPIPVDVRIVSATHRALREEVEAGRFRGDLMYRLRVIPLFLPPLRDRPRDVMLLVQRFIDELNPTRRRAIHHVTPAAMRALERHRWPGNVRELRNVLAYGYAIGDGPILELTDLPPEIADPELGPLTDMSAASQQVRAETSAGHAASSPADTIARALEVSGGHRGRAAEALGISRVTLWRKMREFGLA